MLKTVPFVVPLTEITCTYARSSGPGGQNVNKVNSKCVLRWPLLSSPSIPQHVRDRFASLFGTRLTSEGELVVTSDRFRDQKRNFEDCLAKVQAMLTAAATPPKPRRKTRPTRSSQQKRKQSKQAHSKKKAMRRGYGL